MEIDMEIFKNGPLSFWGSDTVQAPINWLYDKALADDRKRDAENYYKKLQKSHTAGKTFTPTSNEEYAWYLQQLKETGSKKTPADYGMYEDPRAWQIGLEFLPTTYFNRAAVDLNKGRNEEAAWNAGTGAAYALAGPVAKLTKPAYGFATAALPEAAHYAKSLFQGPLSKGMLGKYYDQLGVTQ